MNSSDLLRAIETVMRPLKQRVMAMLARGILESVKDDGGIQFVKVSLLKDEVRDGLERIQNFGFTSNPPKDSEVLAIFAGGNREHGFVIACDKRAVRFKNLASGETAIYTDDGTHIHLKKGGEVIVKAATKLTVDVPDATFKGNVKVEGKVEVQGNISTEADLRVGGSETVTGTVTASDVTAAGTSMSAIKVHADTHTHLIVLPVPGTPTGPPVPPL